MPNGEPTKSDLGGLLSPGFFVLLASILGYVTFQPPLKSVRPELVSSEGVPAPPSPPNLSAVHSRLWGDPLTVAFKDYQRTLQGEQAAAGPLKYWLERLAGADRTAAEREAKVISSLFQKMVDQIVNAGAAASRAKGRTLAGRVLCMPVLVPGEPYADDTEQRKRITYAVLSALNACHYDLTYPDRLTYVNVPLLVDYGATSSPIPTSLVVPVKLLERSTAPGVVTTGDVPEAVIVCWINEAQLGARPLVVVAQVLECLFGNIENRESKVAVHILGPDSSDTLLDMAEENSRSLKQGDDRAPDDGNRRYREATVPDYFSRYADPVLYSGRATVSASYVASEVVGDPHPLDRLNAFTNGRKTSCGLRVVRTIGTDERLVELIASELWLRGAWPGLVDPRTTDNSGRFQGNKGRYVVLVSELDTLAGQTLPRTFRNRFPNVFQASPPPARGRDVLQVFSYLRGIDGKLPEKGQKNETPSESGARSDLVQPDPLRAPSPETNPASGRSQTDYLRRLEADLIRFHDERRAQGEDGIVAIGVMGTDVYDKLLVLRALRGRFPSVCFFTTDCDAELSLSEEYPTTRNVVVASHFGLRLHPDLQGETPPFRDSYQTATYFQCLLAMRDPRLSQSLRHDDPWGMLAPAGQSGSRLEPLVFEVARHGLYQVSLEGDPRQGDPAVQPPSSRKSNWLLHWRHAIFAAVAVVLLWSILSRMLTDLRKVLWPCLFALLVVAILFGIAARDHGQPDGEPFELFEGISLWPPTIIRAVAFVLALGLIYKGWVDLEKSAHRHDMLVTSATAVAPPATGLWTTLVAPVKVSRKEVARLGLIAWLKRDVIIAHWPHGELPAAMDLREQYRVRGRALPRLLRSGAMSLAYFMFAISLLWITDALNMPFRGPTVRFWASSTLLAAVMFMIAVTFFSFDAMQLCRRFVKYVAAGPPDWPDHCAGMTRLKQTRHPREDDDVRELLTVQIIAERTQVVGKLVTYPFWVLLLLILSRHPSFDFLDFPPALLVLWGLSLGGALLWAWSLRREAGHARNEIVSRLRDSLAAASGHDDDASRLRAEQLRQFISDVRREDRGAFRPFMQDPIVTALATLLGGTGGVMLIEQLLPYR
ncbi:MAG TPA: hypothetical protein VND64_24715 [Pirellulales bacterium]|nr:hypothetical protein [Pirellulales bacterium]